jgi:hypothetical protein
MMTQYFSATKAFRDGWSGFNLNAGTLVGFTVLATVVLAVFQSIQYGLITASVNNIATTGEAQFGLIILLFAIALFQAIAGLIISIALLDGSLSSIRGKKIGLPDFFAKITEVPNLIGLQLFGGIAIFLGFLTFIFPGVYLVIAYIFSGMVLVDKPQSFVDALNISRRLVTPHWFDLSLFLLVVAGIIILGYLACLVGGFVSVPVGFCMIAAAYKQLLILGDESDQSKGSD